MHPMPEILLEIEGPVATITLNRPDKLNALAGTMRQDLVAALRDAGSNEAVRAVIITGAGRAFCAGGDVEFMSGLQARGEAEEFGRLLDAGREVVVTIRNLDKPVLASINGVAAGAGCNLALACDYRIGSDKAVLGQTFVKIGLHPDWGGTFFLPRLASPSRAMEMMMTGRMVEAAEAFSIGLLDRIVPAELLEEKTRELAETIAQGPPHVIAAIKRALYASAGNTLEAQVSLESANQKEAFLSEDAAEGMRAFFEKRKPVFRG